MSIRTQLHRIRKDTRQADLFINSVWHVDSSVSASGSGVSWETAFKTIAEAIAAASAGDTIKADGEFNESGLELDKELTLVGQNTSNNQYTTMIYSDAATPLITILANNCKIMNIGFAQQAAQAIILLGDTAAQNWYKLHIKDCRLDGWGTATSGISFGDVTIDAPDIHVENCLFRSIDGNYITSNATRGRYEDNIFILTAGNIGIEHIPTTSSRPDTIISGNRIIGVNSTDTGIKITNTPDAGTLIAFDNYIFNCATSITQKAENVAVQMNYVNDTAGGALIDPIA